MPFHCTESAIHDHLGMSLPSLTMLGTSAASHGPRAIASAWAMPSLGECLAHRGAKWMSWQILPPRYILMVLPSSSGSSSSMGLLGQVAGISNWRRNSYLTRLQVQEQTPCQRVPSLVGSILNQSLSCSLLDLTQVMMARSSSFSRSFHFSSLGPACTVSSGILLAASSIELIMLIILQGQAALGVARPPAPPSWAVGEGKGERGGLQWAGWLMIFGN